MKIVAFGHRQNVGKDLASKFFISQVRAANSHIDVRRIGLADVIKETAYNLFKYAGLDEMDFYENHPDRKERALNTIGKSPRDIWLTLGKAIQGIDPTALINIMLCNVACDILIISDLRRAEEANFLMNMKGSYLVKLIRDVPRLEDTSPNHDYKDLDSQLDTFQHWYRVIDNNGTTKDLNNAIRPLVQEVMAAL